MARSRETKIELTAYDDLFQTDESREEAKLSKIRDIPISEIDEFPDHPFKVLMDEDMEQLVKSIKRNGVMTPATVRLKEDGRYELISGHRRKKACEIAGLETLKCEVKELTRDEAIIVMVESNLQRSVILPSEKAFAYKMRLEAMKRQAGRPAKENYSPVGNNSEFVTSSDELAEKVGESKNQIFRYIRLTELVPKILQMVDESQIDFRPAVEISYLTEEQQYTLLEAMEYNDAQKKELFGKVRSGEVRVLLGSTPKMGAGTNVQDRLIAIHNLDCPWRPSDLEQRQGRIERQGNMFPEVEVYRYVTEQTFDAYLYQLVESKQKFISQIMTSKSPVRSAEDVDEVALSFAEVKMLATGDARFKEKMDLDIQVSKIRVLKQSYLSEHYDLEDRVLKYYPQTIKEYEERIADYENDAALAEQHKPQGEDKFCPMTLKGVTYTEKADAGEMLLAICKDYPMSAATEIGSYRGFRIEIYYDTVNAHYCMNLCGKTKHKVDLGSDALGNLTRIENELSKLPARLEAAKTKKAETIAQLEIAKEEIKKPFAFEDELKEKTERLNALNIELNLNEKDTSVMDTEPEQAEEQPERKCASRER